MSPRAGPPLVSCIVPARDAERFIAAALDSVLAQAAAPLELIVVDDGSTDGTAAIVARYGAAVRLVRGAAAGTVAARLAGLAQASGRFIAFNDADDLWCPGKLVLQLARFAAEPGLDLCVGQVQNFRGELVPEGAPVPGYYLPALLARREAFVRVGPFDAARRHSSELDWFARARELGLRDALLPETLVYRRLHDRNMSRLHAGESLREHLRTLRDVIHRQR